MSETKDETIARLEMRLLVADGLLRRITPPEGLLKERQDFDAESWLTQARAYLASPAPEAELRKALRQVLEYADRYADDHEFGTEQAAPMAQLRSLLL